MSNERILQHLWGEQDTWSIRLQFRRDQLVGLIRAEAGEEQGPQQPQHSKEVEDRGPADMLDEGATQDQAHSAAYVKTAEYSCHSTRSFPPAHK